MNQETAVTLRRDVEAVRIPSGEKVPLQAGISVVITQSLGGSYTVFAPGAGGLCRIDGRDADALGFEPARAEEAGAGAAGLEERVWEQLRSCYDPEIPVNIVDLGLIYDLQIQEGEGGAVVMVKMTLTAPGCGMGPVIAGDARSRIAALEGVREAVVDVVWDPPWGPERISPEGRRLLGIE